jgi:lysophospholipase L1-like esterase
VRLVTVTVGANDLDVAGLAQICAAAPSSADCQAAILERQAQFPELFASLRATFSAIAATAPKARIIVTGYAPLTSSGPIFIATQALNAVIRNAVLSVATAGAKIRFVDVQFTGHTLDSPDPWFAAAGPDAFHPTAAGEFEYAESIAVALHIRHGDRYAGADI